MDRWLVYLLIALGALVVAAIILSLLGQKELAKKILFPFILIGGAFVVGSKLFGAESNKIREENERIKRELEEIKNAREKLQSEIAIERARFEEERKLLRSAIAKSDSEAQALLAKVDEMNEKGPEAWFNDLPSDKKKEILGDPKDLPDDFFGPNP